jgi:hypothetical protein
VKRYINLPIKELISDVPVDPVHTRELADSIMTKGQLAPVIIREETREVIDGFHRIAAMKELGFKEVEGVLTPCDDEGFWDFRIIQASLHKNVTFARAIDWIDKVFQLSPWRNKYRSAATLFQSARRYPEKGDKEVRDWAEAKAKMWGLSVGAIEDWMKTKEHLEPSLLQEAREGVAPVPRDAYVQVATILPNKPELQKRVIEKAKAEDLSWKEIKTTAQALRRAGDEEEVQSILRQPVSRTADQMVRDAKVEKVLGLPETSPTTIEITGDALICMMDYNKLTTSLEHLGQHVDTIPPHAKRALHAKGLETISKIQEFNLKLYPSAKVGSVKEIKQ